ncbi:MAG TPA: hypothetical protein VM033_00360, partial [Gemmatimonadaceae bacterium]|nr:hypothetical protein [Gemmatimonadaceae bacterium]
MDLYVLSLSLGAAGLATMAVGGLGHHGPGHHGADHGGGLGHGGHAHGGHGHGGHAGHGDLVHGHASHGAHGHDAHGHGAHGHDASRLLSLLSPRVLFSVLVGFGAAGLVARHLVAGPLVLAIAIAGGIAFEGLLVGPLWKQLFRFASSPALTLESAVQDEARAV